MFATTSVERRKLQQQTEARESLRYDYYQQTCPQAEQIIRSSVRDLCRKRPQIAPALLRLVFHDCFVEGCDASVLLDSVEGMHSEKESPPNESLKGFDVIDIIKSELEEACPGVVLAARESVISVGGPFYPLKTGRRDGLTSFAEDATFELPQDDLSKFIETFSSKGFDEREAVSLLGSVRLELSATGAHSTGNIHCKFFINRLYNFSGTNSSDPSMDSEFLSLLRSKCNTSQASLMSPASKSLSSSQLISTSPSPSSIIHELSSSLVEEPAMKMDYEGPGESFGTLYYRSLLQGRGILYVDQQLTAGEETKTWVQAYASDESLFHKDFGLTMMKLSILEVQTSPMGQIRKECHKVS
ncbi:hypothetical protein RND71_017128 [Anisodus tanguticus]|uniref:Peroxidase n=1 Tax=Anisodus tanguticus TaxID=243964 RepID=A0AAE1S268_9SOLA|nr:hypothetical protein RND71_017128 [Anisodus tanguticus]